MQRCSGRRLMTCPVPSTGQAITGVNKTIKYVPTSESLSRFGQAMNWFFVTMLALSGAVYFVNGIRYDTTSSGASMRFHSTQLLPLHMQATCQPKGLPLPCQVATRYFESTLSAALCFRSTVTSCGTARLVWRLLCCSSTRPDHTCPRRAGHADAGHGHHHPDDLHPGSAAGHPGVLQAIRPPRGVDQRQRRVRTCVIETANPLHRPRRSICAPHESCTGATMC